MRKRAHRLDLLPDDRMRHRVRVPFDAVASRDERAPPGLAPFEPDHRIGGAVRHEDRHVAIGRTPLFREPVRQHDVRRQGDDPRQPLRMAHARVAARSRRPARTRRGRCAARSMPRAFSRAMSASMCACDSRTPATSARFVMSPADRSYHARIRNPLLSVTGRTGACGKTKRIGSDAGSRISPTIGTKSLPSAPRPCSQMTAAAGFGPVSSSMDGSSSAVMGVSRQCRAAHFTRAATRSPIDRRRGEDLTPPRAQSPDRCCSARRPGAPPQPASCRKRSR